MACSHEEKLIAYLGGELAPDEVPVLLTHVKTCDECWQAARELMFIRRGLDMLAEASPCPSREDIFAYTDNGLAGEEGAVVAAHLDMCYACRTLVQDLQSLGLGQEGRDDADVTHRAKAAALSVVEGFLPGTRRYFERLWQRARSVLEGEEDNAGAVWNARTLQGHVAGTLGAGAADPVSVTAFIALMTSLAVARDIKSSVVDRSEEAIKDAIQRRASGMGAGKGLIGKLCEILPGALLDT